MCHTRTVTALIFVLTYFGVVSHTLPDEPEDMTDNSEFPEVTQMLYTSFDRKRRNAGGRRVLIWDKHKRGGKCIVPYAIMSDYSEAQMAKITGAIQEIDNNTCIKFQSVDKAKIENDYKDKSHVAIRNVAGRGCYSTNGRIKGQMSEVNLEIRLTPSKTCISHHVILITLMRALGFAKPEKLGITKNSKPNWKKVNMLYQCPGKIRKKMRKWIRKIKTALPQKRKKGHEGKHHSKMATKPEVPKPDDADKPAEEKKP